MVFFYITYALAWLLLFIAPDLIVLPGEATTDPITLSTFCVLYIMGGGYWWLRKYKHHPIIGPVYTVVNLFFMVLFAILMGNYIKKEIKEWWKNES